VDGGGGSKENARSLVPRGRAVGCDVKQRWRRGGIRTQKSTTGLDGPFQPTSARQLGLIPCGPIRLRRLSPTILYCTPHLLSFVLPAGRSPLLALRLAPSFRARRPSPRPTRAPVTRAPLQVPLPEAEDKGALKGGWTTSKSLCRQGPAG
jgi:hypothetical protein